MLDSVQLMLHLHGLSLVHCPPPSLLLPFSVSSPSCHTPLSSLTYFLSGERCYMSWHSQRRETQSKTGTDCPCRTHRSGGVACFLVSTEPLACSAPQICLVLMLTHIVPHQLILKPYTHVQRTHVLAAHLLHIHLPHKLLFPVCNFYSDTAPFCVLCFRNRMGQLIQNTCKIPAW